MREHYKMNILNGKVIVYINAHNFIQKLHVLLPERAFLLLEVVALLNSWKQLQVWLKDQILRSWLLSSSLVGFVLKSLRKVLALLHSRRTFSVLLLNKEPRMQF